MKKNTKKVCQRCHAKKRLFERYGLVMKSEEMKSLCELLGSRNRNNDIVLYSERLSHKDSYFIINYNDLKYPIIWDRKRKQIVTFLPQEEERFQRYCSGEIFVS